MAKSGDEAAKAADTKKALEVALMKSTLLEKQLQHSKLELKNERMEKQILVKDFTERIEALVRDFARKEEGFRTSTEKSATSVKSTQTQMSGESGESKAPTGDYAKVIADLSRSQVASLNYIKIL